MLPRSLTLRFPGPDRHVSVQLTEGGVVAVVCVAIAGLVALVTDIGSNADLSFYATVAQVLPVFLLALVVEIRARLDRSFNYAVSAINARAEDYEQLREFEQTARAQGLTTPEFEQGSTELAQLGEQLAALRSELADSLPLVQRVVRGYVLAAVPGEAGSLAALAMGSGSTFYFALAISSLVALLALYMRTVSAGFEPTGHARHR